MRLKRTIDQIDVIIIYRALHLTATEYTFLSATHEAFSKGDHILGILEVITNFKNWIIVLHLIW